MTLLNTTGLKLPEEFWLQRPEVQAKVLTELQQLVHDEGVLPSPREFIESSDYLGSMVEDLHENWKQELAYVLDPDNGITEWVLRGAIGTGKTTCASIAQLYKILWLVQWPDPALICGLLPKSNIVVGVFSITLAKADRVYTLIREYLDGCPYFATQHPRQQKPNNPIKIPDRNITIQTGSLEEHALSENLFGFCIDEANFFKKSKDPLLRAEKTRAHALYRQAQRRQETRFQRLGKIPGLTCLISSQRTQTEFVEERVARAANDSRVHVTTFALWDVKPKSNYCGTTFEVMIGDGKHSSRLLETDELPEEDCEVIEVPVEHYRSFEEDTDEALRDLAGRAVTGAGFFFAQREHLYHCVDRSRVHPFTVEEVTQVSTEGGTLLSELLRTKLLFHRIRSRFTPRVDPGVSRFVHVDIGLTNDSLGLAIGHETREGALYFDILLRVCAPARGEVDLDEVIDFIRFLRQCGLSFKSVTYDSYQSRHSLQRLRKRNFKAELLSIGIAQYRELRRLIYAGAVNYYEYAPALREAAELLKDPKGGDPDHPPHGSNDVIDAMAGVASQLGETLGTSTHRGRKGVMLPVVGG